MFVSGPYVRAYRARATEDGRLLGIRCVKFANLTDRPDTQGVAFVWYGEDGRGHRHFGECFLTHDGVLTGHVAFLNSGFVPVQLAFSAGDGLSRLSVTGGWQEEWELCEGGVFDEFTGTPHPITTSAGQMFREFQVRNRDGTPGHGIRLMLSSGSWLGAGAWRGVTYLHLGTYIGDPSREGHPVKFGAADICHMRGFCGWVDWGQMLVRPAESLAAGTWEVLGIWTEEWTLRHPPSGWEPAAEVAHLTVFRP